MANRVENLSIDQLDQLNEQINKALEAVKELKSLEQQFTHAPHPDIRIHAIQDSLERQRLGYGALRTRKEIIGH